MSDAEYSDHSAYTKSKPLRRNIPRGKPKVKVIWNDNDIKKLIQYVQMEECLWHPNHINYKNKIIRSEKWHQIVKKDFHNVYDVSDLVAKWTNMRVQFRSYFVKEKQQKWEQNGEHKIVWKFYNSMKFIANVEEIHSTKTRSNLVSILHFHLFDMKIMIFWYFISRI